MKGKSCENENKDVSSKVTSNHSEIMSATEI